MRAAVLGTGIMGAPIARRLAAAHEVCVWNRTRSKADGLGAAVTASPAEAVDGVEVVITMLADGPAVDHVMAEALPALPPEALWVQMSTVAVAETLRFAALADDHGALYVDSPVLGSRPQAEEGSLRALASGRARARERAEPLLRLFCRDVFWLGDQPGLGTSLKLVANLWIMNLVQNLAESFVLAEALGLERRSLLEAIRGLPMDSPYAQVKGEKILSGDYSAAFTLQLALKDVRLAIAAAEDAGVELGLAAVTEERFQRAIELGHGDEDTAAAYFASARRE
jgi:3-hydroxyisobutyrate dehydrogenase